MSDNKAYIPLDSVIQDYLLESEQSQTKYFKCFHLAFRGFEDLGIDAFFKIQSVKLPINANLTVTLPANYLNWTKIGVLNSRGEIIPLWNNDNFTTYADLLPDRVEKTTDNTMLAAEWNNNLWLNWWNGYSYNNIYGVPSGHPIAGSFKVDSENGVIVLNHNFTAHYDYLMLEYVASPKEGQEYYLPMQFREALIAWLWWKDGKARPTTTHMRLGAARDAKHEYYTERRNAIARWKPVRNFEAYQTSQEQTRMAIKS